jgi:hypothetical protein
VSKGLLARLRNNNVITLFDAWDIEDVNFYRGGRKLAGDIGLVENIVEESETYVHRYAYNFIKFKDKKDRLVWSKNHTREFNTTRSSYSTMFINGQAFLIH